MWLRLKQVVLRLRGAPAEPGLLETQPFLERLRYERLRCDRSGRGFSLATFTLPCSNRLNSERRRLAEVLRRRLRETDLAGVLDARRIAVLLPETTEAGACALCRDVQALHASPGSVLTWHVEEYLPTDPFPQEMQPCEPSSRGGRSAVSLRMLLACPMPAWKRAVDVLGAGLGLLVFSPLMLLTAALVKVTSPGPVLFRQLREGLGGRAFVMYKFRTMRVGAEQERERLRRLSEQDGPAFKMTNDPRVTAIGRFLRRTSIDELPQLWNVLRGEMSLVGPRPLPCIESRDCRGWQRRRLDVTPGLTCIWQVRGRSRVAFREWMRMDLQYLQRRSLATDMRILLQTVPAVLLQRGAK